MITYDNTRQFVSGNFWKAIELVIPRIIARCPHGKNKRPGCLRDNRPITLQQPHLHLARAVSVPPILQESDWYLHGKAGRLLGENGRAGPIQRDTLRTDNFLFDTVHVHWPADGQSSGGCIYSLNNIDLDLLPGKFSPSPISYLSSFIFGFAATVSERKRRHGGLRRRKPLYEIRSKAKGTAKKAEPTRESSHSNVVRTTGRNNRM